MKRIMQCVIMFAVMLLLGATNPNSFKRTSTTNATVNQSLQPNALLEYEWYYDPYYTSPVGVSNTVSQELTRLRATYGPSYVFSATQGMGLSAYEYGTFSNYSVVIYSDL